MLIPGDVNIGNFVPRSFRDLIENSLTICLLLYLRVDFCIEITLGLEL